MPNYVMNQISVQGDPKEIQSMLEQIKNDDFGIGTVDFDKIIPMPKSLDIESGTRTENGLKAYRQFIKSYTSGKTARNALKSLRNIPLESENAFLCQRPDISREEWDLGKAAWHNLQDYGAATALTDARLQDCCIEGTVFERTDIEQAYMQDCSNDEQDWSEDSGPVLSM